MADQLDLHPEAATLNRSHVVCKLIQRTFAVTYINLSQLEGRTIRLFSQANNLSYIHRFFTNYEKDIVDSNTSVEKYDVHLLHKLLKTCCGLRPHSENVWKSEEEADTLEFLITYCWSEYKSLCEAPEMTDSNLNHHMDKVLEALVLIIEKVEEQKDVDESALKYELTKHIGEKLDKYDDSHVSHHKYEYIILSQHSVHMMLVIVYQQLNNLKGMRLSKFLTYRRINLTSQTLYSNEHKFLQQNPLPQNMSISILYKVVQRVCFGFNPYRKSKQSSVLQSTLSQLKQEYYTPPASEEDYMEKCYKIYELLKTALVEVTKQKGGKSIRQIIQNLPREPYVVESFRKPFELPTCSMQPVSMSPAPNPHSPKEPSDVPMKCSVSSPHALSQPMAAASATASSPGRITQEEINVAVLFKVLCPGGVAVQTLALVFKALQGNVPSAPKKGNFTKDEKATLKYYQSHTDIDNLTNADVTLVCKLLRTGCPSLSKNDDVWTSQEGTLEYCISCIRKERNKLSHDVKTIETNVLNKTLQLIETHLDTILEMTEQKLGNNEKDIKKALKEQRTKVHSEIQAVANCMPINSYYLTMEKIKEDMIHKTIVVARTELQQMHLYRENLYYMSPLSGSDDIQQSLTTKVVYVDRELEDTSDIKAEGSYHIKDILFSQDNAFASSRVIVIHGRPGEGKTSICKHAYHLWSENLAESSQKGVDLFIYIPCRFVTTKGISAYLKERLPETFKNIDKDDIIPLMQEPRVVFVIDGYDEARGEANSLIDDILRSMPDSRMIITTKTQWAPKISRKVRSVTSHYKILSIMEVTDDVRQQFIRKIFKAVGMDTKNCDRFLDYLNKMKEKIYELICCPLTFCLLSLLWIKNPENAKKTQTLAQLYHKLIELILERVSEKIVKDKFYCRQWMMTLGEIAWKNLKNNQHQLNNHDLDTLKKRALLELKLDVEDNNCILSSLLQCDEVHDSLDDDVKSWNFNSQQEYFAAEYIVDCLINKNSPLSEILELTERTDDKYKAKLQRLVPLIEFVCGLLEIHGGLTEARVREITEIMSLTEPWSFIAVTKMFKPLLQKSGVEHVVRTLFMNQEMSTFENYDPQSTLWVLKHTSLTVLRQVTFIHTVSELPHVKPLLEFLLKSKSYYVKVMVDVDKVSNISGLAEFTRDMKHKDIVFTFMPWKPLCMAKLLQDWPWPNPLCLSLHSEVFYLLWWELLICLLSLSHQVTKIVYSLSDPRYEKLVEEGAKWLNTKTATDSTLAPTELLIYCA